MKHFARLLLTVITALFAGCVPEELCFRELPADDPNAPLVVAALLPLSGENRMYAEQMQEGLLAAQNKINRYGINGRQLQLEFIDTKGTFSGSADALKLAGDKQAVAAVAGYDSEEVSMLIPHAAKMRMPMVIPLATSDYHLQTSPFIYRNSFSNIQQTEVLANFLVHWRQKSRGAIITDPTGDDEYTREISRDFAQAITDIGGKITMNITLKANSLLSDGQLRSMLMAEPGFILISARGKRAAEQLKSLRQAGFTGIICGADCWDDQEFIFSLEGSEPGDCVFTAFFNEENSSREFRTFRKEFREKFYHYPGACETQSYDALIFLAIGLDNADNLWDFDRNWRTIRNHHGVSGLYTMLKKGEIDRTIYLKTIGVDRRSGKPVPFARFSKKLQHSDLKNYRIIE